MDSKWKQKISCRPGHVPSAAHIAAQKIVVKTKGTKPKSTLKVEPPKLSKPTVSSTEGSMSNTSTPSTSKNNKTDVAAESDDKEPLSVTKKHMGLRVTHHGLIHHGPTIKYHRFQCEMCGNYFLGSTEYITHYKDTHPALPCNSCEKVFTNPLSLKKYNFHHQGNIKTCEFCGRSFPFDCQLNDHQKTYLSKKLHFCSFANCDKSFTHKYNLQKHEYTHTQTVLSCKDCDYKTKDVRNLRQHEHIHTGVKPYGCTKCDKRLTFYIQKKRHSC